MRPGLSTDIDSALARRAAQSNCTLLIAGETGAGKGHLAKWLHDHSSRCNGPYIPVNCGAIPDTLIDSQLFGHAKGAFSGATADHLGLIRAADHGTVLFDEISQLPLSSQNRLMRLLHDREVQPVGHSRPIIVDVRVIAATNVDLAVAVVNGAFREDLLFRLDIIQLRVDPLRDRLHELPGLLQQFNAEFAALYQQNELQFEPAAMNLLQTYHWPGNIRQLRTLVERLHVLCPGQNIGADHVQNVGQLNPRPPNGNGLASVQQIKLEQLRRVLVDSGGSIVRAADALGVHRSTIYRWLRRH